MGSQYSHFQYFTLVDFKIRTAVLSTCVATMSSLAQLWVWDTAKQRQHRRDNARLTKSGNARSEQLLVMPTEPYKPTENGYQGSSWVGRNVQRSDWFWIWTIRLVLHATNTRTYCGLTSVTCYKCTCTVLHFNKPALWYWILLQDKPSFLSPHQS